MTRKRGEGHIRLFPGHSTPYKLIRINGKQQFEHRVVMENLIGRKLLRHEIVHHIDGNGLNNSPDNLEVMTQSQHMKEHEGERRKWSFDEAVKLRKEGITIDNIAKKLNISPSCILKVFNKKGIGTKDLRWGNTKWNLEKAIALYQSGMNIKYISKECGVTIPTISKKFEKIGIRIPKKRSGNHAVTS